jgi:hypothetical protein
MMTADECAGHSSLTHRIWLSSTPTPRYLLEHEHGNNVIGTPDVLHVRPLTEMGKAEVSRRHNLGLLKVRG